MPLRRSDRARVRQCVSCFTVFKILSPLPGRTRLSKIRCRISSRSRESRWIQAVRPSMKGPEVSRFSFKPQCIRTSAELVNFQFIFDYPWGDEKRHRCTGYSLTTTVTCCRGNSDRLSSPGQSLLTLSCIVCVLASLFEG